MKKIIKVFIIVLLLSCFMTIVGCSYTSKLTVENFNDRQQEIYFSIMNNDLEQYSSHLAPYAGDPYMMAYAASITFCDFGVEAVPIIITALSDDSIEPIDEYYKVYLSRGMYTILRIDPLKATEGDGSNLIYTDTSIYAFYKHAKTEISKIIASEISLEEKLNALRKYGIYAVPEVVEQINEGNSEYEKFFVYAGLHLNDEDFVKIAGFKYLFSNDLHTKEDYLTGAEDFDYKVWLEENEEDLDNLFKFLDAYCAEYESENKS